MKKTIFISCLAVVALASCSKSEDLEPSQAQKEIAFSVATDKLSRAPITGAAFAADQKIYVSATNSVSGNYFENVAFAKDASTWKAGKVWPVNGVTSFLAYAFTPATNSAMDESTAVWGTKLAESVEFDLSAKSLYSEAAAATTDLPAGSTDADFTPYVDLLYANADQTKEGVYNTVPMTFSHTGAWIVFNVKAVGLLSGATLTLNTFDIAKIFKGGKLTIDNTVVGGAKASWDFSTLTAADYAVESFPQTSGVVLDGSYKTFGVIVPEQNQTAFNFKYTLASTGATDQVVNYVHNLNRFDKWQMGKKYVYNITISFTEIEIEPSVTDWGTPIDSDINI
ncbi:MAG: fimbrillin family protein [Muribaculaceae bacterium]